MPIFVVSRVNAVSRTTLQGSTISIIRTSVNFLSWKDHFPRQDSGSGPLVAPASMEPSFLSTTEVAATSLSSSSSSCVPRPSNPIDKEPVERHACIGGNKVEETGQKDSSGFNNGTLYAIFSDQERPWIRPSLSASDRVQHSHSHPTTSLASQISDIISWSMEQLSFEARSAID